MKKTIPTKTKKTSSNLRAANLFAFWEYDSPPFFLGGTITELRGHRRVCIKEYENNVFRPVIIVPLAQGEAILRRLREADSEYKKDCNKLHAGFVQLCNEIVKRNSP